MGKKLQQAAGKWIAVLLMALSASIVWSGSTSVAASASNGSGSLIIVDNGAPHAVVIVAEQADDTTRRAADELVEYVRKSTGAVLPVMTEQELHTNGGSLNVHVRLYVGDSGSDPHMANLLQGLDDDGFVIHPHGNCIVIAGPTPSGTAYGVYDFLERYAGVRWLLPGPDGEDVPLSANLSVPGQDVREEPVFFSRVFSPGTSWTQYPERSDWLDKNRLHNRIHFHHNLLKLFPPSQYGTTHPEYFPIRNGQRYIPPTDTTHGWQPCFTAPGIVEEAVSNIIRYFANNPDETSYSLGVNDSGGYCEANPDHPDYPNKLNSIGLVDMSDLYYNWVNQVAEGVLAVYPDKWFGLLAYQEVMDPPSFPLNARVVPFLTKDRMAWADSAVEAAGQAQVQQWAAVTSNLAWYDYMYGTPYLVPRVYNHQMADNYKFAAQSGVTAHYAELYPNWGEGPKPWISAKLQWNPSADVDALLQEWYVRAVGPAAAADLAAYYDHWEQFWTQRVKATDWFESRKTGTYLAFNSADYLNIVTDREIADSRALLESVAAKAQTAPQKARANLLLRAFEYYEASALSYPKDTAAPADSASALAMLDEMDRTLGTKQLMLQKRLDLVDAFKNDPVLVHYLDPRTYSLTWPLWNAKTYWDMAGYLERNEPNGGPVTDQVAALAAGGTSPQMKSFARLLKEARSGLFQMAANGSFDSGSTTAAPWTNWIQSTGTIQRSTELARSGAASLKIQGLDRGGPVQVFPVEPGLLAARTYYKVPAGYAGKGTIQLAMNLRDSAGKQIGSARGKTVRLAGGAGTWNEAIMLYDIPAQVGGAAVKSVQFIVIVDSLTDGTAYLDDVSVFQNRSSLNLESTFWPVLDYIRSSGPQAGDIRQAVTDTVYGSVYGSEREWARLLLTMADGGPPASANSSFELGSGTAAAPWTYWVSTTGSIARSNAASRSGQYGLLIQNMVRGGPVQAMNAVPGRFAAEAFYKVKDGTPANGTIQLAVNFQDAQGKTLSTTVSEVRALNGSTPGSWEPIRLKGVIPATAGGSEVKKLQLVVIADKVTNGAELLVDDVYLYATPASP
ncbi:DUF4838 domain-containing protein [Paenibacillus mesophilus]|uniref:DUF4838 domain-containing protein n=1 Tax=Paenibacillus mesophilus TaxID=2582849 RepID=UPI00110D2DA3|nr:DUF4838 domain-containing protein [Paenibacillus mesophilus]TMV45776.1 DUF4838 domain-containing protein [Paenibacillus mesophilus]